MKRPSLSALRSAYDAQQRNLVGWLTALPDKSWHQPSVLEAWTVGQLAFHTTEVPGSMTRALAGGPVRDKPFSIAEYTSAWAKNADEIASRDRKGAAGLGKADILRRQADEHASFTAALDAVTRDYVVRARRGPIRLNDFLATRVNELVVHSRDLSVSVPAVAPVDIDAAALGVAVRMLLGVLAERAPGKSVEVRVPPYAAAQCVEGPRHTRGTPPNVVETDPLTWVELACARVRWADAVRSGRVSASGERADLSAYLPVLA
jgi:uncharacterized protein (TIGR03083 family)